MEKIGKWIQRAGALMLSVVLPLIGIYMEFNLDRFLELVLLGGLITLWGNVLTEETDDSLTVGIFSCIGLACYIYLNELWLAVAMGISGALLTGLNYLLNRKSADEEPVQLHNE